MTPRERWLALLNNQKPDRVPSDIWYTSEVFERLMRDLGCPDRDSLFERLHIDGVDNINPRRTVTTHSVLPDRDIWGIGYSQVDYGGGSYSEPVIAPLADMTTVEEIHAFAWPDPYDHDWDDFAERAKTVSGRRIVECGGYEPFLTYCYMRGREQSMIDLLLYPDIADAIMDHLFDYHYRRNARAWEMAGGKADMTYVAEDLGSQHGLLMGLEQIRRFFLPRQKKMADLARSFGIHVFYHTDGAARDVIPDLINVTGIEVLNPIQWRCPGMEREGLVRDFADKVIFHGAVDNQQTLAFGTVQDVRQEVRDNLRIFAWPARWICAPCHNIQPVSPTANIVAMYETLWSEGKL